MRRTMTTFAAAATAAAVPAVAQEQVPAQMVPADGAFLDVVAEGRTKRVPDLAILGAGVVTEGDTAAAALSANAQRMERVMAALKRAGVADRDIRTANLNLSPRYRYGENQPPVITGYQASNRVQVRFRDIAKSGPILDALVREGANQIDGPRLSLSQPDAAMDEARRDAIERARARAQLYAQAAGMRVDRIVNISENAPPQGGPMPIVVTGSRMMAEAADTKIAAGEQEVEMTVHVRFLLR
jgi:uncharacterized protein YggE